MCNKLCSLSLVYLEFFDPQPEVSAYGPCPKLRELLACLPAWTDRARGCYHVEYRGGEGLLLL